MVPSQGVKDYDCVTESVRRALPSPVPMPGPRSQPDAQPASAVTKPRAGMFRPQPQPAAHLNGGGAVVPAPALGSGRVSVTDDAPLAVPPPPVALAVTAPAGPPDPPPTAPAATASAELPPVVQEVPAHGRGMLNRGGNWGNRFETNRYSKHMRRAVARGAVTGIDYAARVLSGDLPGAETPPTPRDRAAQRKHALEVLHWLGLHVFGTADADVRARADVLVAQARGPEAPPGGFSPQTNTAIHVDVN